MQETRTMIGVRGTDNKITASYCTNEGDPSTTGILLDKTYNNLDSVKNIIENGVKKNGLNIETSRSPQQFRDINEFKEVHSHVFRFLYMFSEKDNKWYVSSNGDKYFNPLSEIISYN